MERFVFLFGEDSFKTTNKPKELPNMATRKIAAFAAVRPMMKFVEKTPDCSGAIVTFRMWSVCVVFVPKKK